MQRSTVAGRESWPSSSTGACHVATVDIPAPAPLSSTSTSIDDRTTVAAAAPPPPVTEATAPPTAAPATTTAVSSGDESATAAVVIGALAALTIAAVGVWLVMRRRASRDDGLAMLPVVSPQPEPVSPEPPAVVPVVESPDATEAPEMSLSESWGRRRETSAFGVHSADGSVARRRRVTPGRACRRRAGERLARVRQPAPAAVGRRGVVGPARGVARPRPRSACWSCS